MLLFLAVVGLAGIGGGGARFDHDGLACVVGQETPKENRKVTMELDPTQPHPGNPYIRLNVNGVKGLFLLDTGMMGKGSTIAPPFATTCKLAGEQCDLRLDDGKGAAIDLKNFTLSKMAWGGGDGSLGFSFFEVVRMTIDYPQRTATFERYPEGKEEEREKKEEGSSVPFRFLPAKKGTWVFKGPFIDATVNGKKILLIMDTGANWSSINEDVMEKNGIPSQKKKNYSIANVNFEAGELKLTDVGFAKLTNGMLGNMSSMTGEQIGGIVGNNILGQYRITFDYKKKVALFVPSTGKAWK